MVDFKDCIKFANETKDCYVATMEGDQPRVRALGLLFADETGFYFQAYTLKAIYKQLKDNPNVELNFCAPDPRGGPMVKVMRVSGKAKFVNDCTLMTRCIEKDRPYLQFMGIDKPDDPRLMIFQVYTGEAYFWDMANNLKESEIPRIKF